MDTERLEYRMYGLVPYNLSPIQQGIQFGHAVVEYLIKYAGTTLPIKHACTSWALNDKTFIILNGGTTNSKVMINGEKDRGKPLYKGSLNNHRYWLELNGISHATFNEPDLGDQLTAVVFLTDERVWDHEKYPDFDHSIHYFDLPYPEAYSTYVLETFGTEKNYELRHWLRQFKLA